MKSFKGVFIYVFSLMAIYSCSNDTNDSVYLAEGFEQNPSEARIGIELRQKDIFLFEHDMCAQKTLDNRVIRIHYSNSFDDIFFSCDLRNDTIEFSNV